MIEMKIHKERRSFMPFIRDSFVCVLLLGTFASSCSNEHIEPLPTVSNQDGLSVSVGGPLLRSANVEEVLDGMRLYCFDRSMSGGEEPGVGSESSYSSVGIANPTSPFHHIVQGLTKTNMTLYTNQMRVGKWDVVTLSPCGASFSAPLASRQADQLLMYTFHPSENDGMAHEFYHSYCRFPAITGNNHPHVNSAISRNVAKIRVVIERAVDVQSSAPAGSHTVTLDGIPKYISWAGTLLKSNSGSFTTDKDNFDVFPNSTAEFVKNVTFTSAAEAGTYKSDTLDYVIPAYRGGDFWRVNPATNALEMNLTPVDTIRKKMTLTVNFTKSSGGVFTKSVTVPVVAKCNQILILKVRMRDVNVEIHPDVMVWEAEQVNGNMGAAYLNVSNLETTVYDGSVSRIYFWSNQPSDSVFVTKSGKSGATVIADMNTQLDRLVGATAVNRHYDPATQQGYIDISNLTLAATQSDLKIYLKAGGLQREITVKRKASSQVLKGITVPYVGTFHRRYETGERIITWHYTGGDWTAYIDDPTGSGADVLIDRFASPAMENNTLYTSRFLDLEANKVREGARSVTGTNRIYFRVGWKTHAPNAEQPRYATITIRKGTNNPAGMVIQKLYLRQGEQADYLMRPSDAINSGGFNSARRPDAVKFAPYNLFYSMVNGGGENVNMHEQLSVQSAAGNENRFVPYPTEAGSFFQWVSVKEHERRAYNPLSPTGLISGWPTVVPTTYWSALGATNETCPVGYRRPNDGSTSGVSGATVAGSEVRQSLFTSPHSGAINGGSALDNSLWGYYADGYFDRLAINDAVGSNAGENAAINTDGWDVAYVGRLFFNPNNQASLFFPAAGYRHHSNGGLYSAGVGFYNWSSSSTSANSALALSDEALPLGVRDSYRSNGFSVRCVLAELSITPQTVVVSSTPGNTSRSITINSSTSWTITGMPTNVNVSPTSGGAGATTVTLTRNNNAYGKSIMTVRNADGRTEHVVVESLYITPDELWLNNNLPGINTKDFDIIVWGGSEDWNIVPGSYPAWLTPTKLPNGKLRLSAQQYLLSDERTGSITVAHADDPNYTTTFSVVQMIYSDIPPFRYFVVKATWLSSDIDIAVEFSGNYIVDAAGQPTSTRVPFDNKAVGWSLGSGFYLNGSPISGTSYTQQQLVDGLLFWGGDATAGQGETVYFNSPLITPDPGDYRNDRSGLPRKININVFTTWFSGSGDATVTVSTYEGGVMVKPTSPNTGEINAFNFYNVSDYSVSPTVSNIRSPSFVQTMTKRVTTSKGVESYRTNYMLFCTITYDRWTRAATINWSPTTPFSMTKDTQLPNTYNPAVKK